MNTNLEFKKCDSSDLNQLVSISKQTFINAFEKDNNPEDFKTYINAAFSKTTILSELENPNSHFYFVYSNNNLVAYFKLNEGDTQNETLFKSSIELERIYVINHYQNRGFGQHILKHIIAIARSKSVQFLWLGVWQKNKSAILFYERFGFIKFNSHPYYIGNDKQTDWLMKYKLA